jgi:hypothetical protein
MPKQHAISAMLRCKIKSFAVAKDRLSVLQDALSVAALRSSRDLTNLDEQ